MVEYVIDADPKPHEDAPIDLINSIWEGDGGTITIEPNAPPQKILWSLKQLMGALAIGFQWSTVDSLKDQGWAHERAEAHVTTMLNHLVTVEVPPIPSKQELEEIAKRHDGEDGSDDTVPEQDSS